MAILAPIVMLLFACYPWPTVAVITAILGTYTLARRLARRPKLVGALVDVHGCTLTSYRRVR